MGDIVEVQIGIIAVPTKDGVMMLPKLRVLTLLSAEHTAVSKSSLSNVLRHLQDPRPLT